MLSRQGWYSTVDSVREWRELNSLAGVQMEVVDEEVDSISDRLPNQVKASFLSYCDVFRRDSECARRRPQDIFVINLSEPFEWMDSQGQSPR